MAGEDFVLFFFFGDDEDNGAVMRAEFEALRIRLAIGQSRPTGKVIGTNRQGLPRYETKFYERYETGAGLLEPEDWEAFRVRNQKALEKLRAEYVGMYQSGLSVEAIQRRVEGDLNKRRIAAERRGFAERVIYISAMEEAKHG